MPDLSRTEERPIRVGGLIITIDGPAGAGKSTMARLLASRLAFSLLDTGALYRAVAIHLMRQGISPEDSSVPQEALKSMDLNVETAVGSMKIFLGAEDISGLLRDEKVGEAASAFSAKPEVRCALLDLQRVIGRKGRVVAEGRDMGTVVFPDAEVKFFITAALDERSRRRFKELVERGEDADWSEVRGEMNLRDHRDESRTAAPLTRAHDAVVVDTTGLSVSEVLERMIAHIANKLPEALDVSGLLE
jgi:cytidylate kinase